MDTDFDSQRKNQVEMTININQSWRPIPKGTLIVQGEDQTSKSNRMEKI